MLENHWKPKKQYVGKSMVETSTESDPLADAMAVEDAPDVPENVRLGGVEMVRDSRGVRLADTDVEDGD